MKTLVYWIIGITVVVALVILFMNSGMQVSGGTPHKCEFSTNINDKFCAR